MSEVGKRLQEERERRRLSIQDIAHVSKIHARYLQAIELGDVDVFPSFGHALGYLNKYCTLLGLPRKQLVALFKDEHHHRAHATKPAPHLYPSKSKNNVVITTRGIVLLAGGIFSIILMLYLLQQLRTLLVAPPLVILSPKEGEVIENNFVVAEGWTSNDAIMRINGVRVDVGEDGAFKEKIELADERSQIIEFSSTNAISKAVTLRQRSIKTLLLAPPSQLSPTAIAGDPIRLTVRVIDDTWMKIEIDNTTMEIILPEGESRTFSGQQKITLRSGKAHMTYVSLNEGVEEQLGEQGAVTRTWIATEE